MNRRLYRSRTDRVLGGVAAGVADYVNADPALVRIAWAILVPLTSGLALLVYIVAWIAVPEAPVDAPMVQPLVGDATGTEGLDAGAERGAAEPGSAWTPPAPVERRDGNAGLIIGAGLVILGLWFLLREYLPGIDWGLIWPLFIVGVGVVILVNATRNRSGPAA
ncbi:MAG TPA: PspC domain-containing protein [Candidatus Limnocylindria bacterium]|nr:PspC domain-containing protein [Candidatus Limnocylindria bacterium]